MSVTAGLVLACGNAWANEAQDLAKKLAYPITSLISLPIQVNYDDDMGVDDGGYRLSAIIQPVIPFSLNEDWNVISRTIVPIVSQDDIYPGAGSQFGLGDIVQSVFFSPKSPTAGGAIWGVGPVVLVPTATDDLLGGEKWGAGPTVVVLKQMGPWTVGALGNHIWSFAGNRDRADVDVSFMQPFVSYTTPDSWTFTLQTETTYNWDAEEWSIPINAVVSKLIRIGSQPISLSAGVRYWAGSPDGGPEGIGFRVGLTFLFPK